MIVLTRNRSVHIVDGRSCWRDSAGWRCSCGFSDARVAVGPLILRAIALGTIAFVAAGCSPMKKNVFWGERLKNCLELPVKVAVDRLELSDIPGSFIDEPPGVARGMSFDRAGASLTLFVRRDDPNFSSFSEDREWDYKAFTEARVVGIRYESQSRTVDFGDIPLSFRLGQGE